VTWLADIVREGILQRHLPKGIQAPDMIRRPPVSHRLPENLAGLRGAAWANEDRRGPNSAFLALLAVGEPLVKLALF
jgi:hypothetical protein